MVAAPRGAGSNTVTVNLIDILGEDDAYEYAAALQKLVHIAVHADVTAVAFKQRIINQLRAEGLDAAVGGMRGFFGSNSDAERTANQVVQPLRAIGEELHNVGRNAHVFRNRVQALVFDPIRIARESRADGTAGLKVR